MRPGELWDRQEPRYTNSSLQAHEHISVSQHRQRTRTLCGRAIASLPASDLGGYLGTRQMRPPSGAVPESATYT
jgi:hypothetical protein